MLILEQKGETANDIWRLTNDICPHFYSNTGIKYKIPLNILPCLEDSLRQLTKEV